MMNCDFRPLISALWVNEEQTALRAIHVATFSTVNKYHEEDNRSLCGPSMGQASAKDQFI